MVSDKYHVVVAERGPYSLPWEWEICRENRPLGARLRAGFFHSESIAEAAGKAALRGFLEALEQEQDAGQRRTGSAGRASRDTYGGGR